MSSLLTVEDYNTNIINNINEYYELDTSKISEQEFNGVLYDFVIVSHSINEDEHTFTFEIHNSLWCGKCCAIDNEGYIINRVEWDNNILTVTTYSDSVKLYLYLCSYAPTFEFVNCIYFPKDVMFKLPRSRIGERLSVTMFQAPGGTQTNSFKANLGVSTLTVPSVDVYPVDLYILVLLQKTDLIFDLNHECTIGIVNHIPLNVSRDYLPGRALVDTELLDIRVKYGDLEILASYDEDLNDYYFDLNLTEKIDDKPVKLTIQVNENELVNPSTTEASLTCNYPTANSFSELQSQIVAGAEIIELTDKIIFEHSLIIPHDVFIIGNNNTIELGMYHVIISDNVNVKFEGGKFLNGESCFIQKPDSILTLTGCDFVNAKIAGNYKGSVVSSNNASSITNITNCSFHNCHHTIYTGSELSVTNCKVLYDNWNDSLDTDYSAFINAFDGIITVTGSICDIDYADKIIDNEEINYALSLIGLSTDCTFNNVAANQLSDNDVLPFFGNFYNNQAHVFVPFYHATVDDVVVASPLLGREDQSVCHRILGTDWVYKNNTQITRMDEANTIRKINWEDM